MRRLVIPAVLQAIVFGALHAQSRPDSAKAPRTTDSVKTGAAETSAAPPPATLSKVTVRATRRRVPSVRAGAIGDATSRDEPQSFQLLDALTQGTLGALLGASPEFVATAGGGFSLLGSAPESNQLTLGGVRLPSGFVTGAVRSTITASPWDVSNGGAAGATINLALARGNTHRSAYMVARSSASGVIAGGTDAPTGLTLPLQLSVAADGPLGRYRYSISGFVNHDAVNLRRWDSALTPASRGVLDSVAAVGGAPLLRASEVRRQYGVLTRLDLPRPTTNGPERQSDVFTLALSRTSDDGGTRGGFATGSAGFTSLLDVGALQFESVRIVRGIARVTSNVAISTSESSVARQSRAPVVLLTDNGLGAIVNVGGSAPQPTTRVSSAEARSQAVWFSAGNTRRYLLQVQSRYEGMRVGSLESQSTFSVSSAADLQQGRAVALTRGLATDGAGARTGVLAPAASIGFDLGRRGSMLIGARADGWMASDIVRGVTLRGLDLSPRVSFQQQVGHRSRGRGAFGTLRGGVGRFADWPSLQQWSPAWSSTGGQAVACSGAAVPPVDIMNSAAECLGGAAAVSTGRLLAASTLAPVVSSRGELSLEVHQLARGVRAEFGVSASQSDRMAVVRSPYFARTVVGRLIGEAGRALIVDPAAITSNGIVPQASLPADERAAPILAPDGRASGYQYRVRLATRDPWARTQLEANYAWNGGSQRAAVTAPAFAAPGLLTAPATGNRHTIMTSIGTWIGVSQFYATVIARSGLRFTPRADRDLNGDGAANDAAFVPVDRAAEWASASPAAVRSCIRNTAGTVIAPNACAGPWSVSSMLMAQIPGPKLGLPRGMEVTLQVTNPTALLARGGGGNVTFGGAAWVDPTLVRVTGFDPAAQRFRTERLQGFGRAVGLSRTVTDPVRIAISLRIPLGRSAFDRRMDETVAILATDTSAAMRTRVAENVFGYLPNIPEVFLKQIPRLQLTREQREALEALDAEWKTITPRAAAQLSARDARDPLARRALLEARAVAVADVQRIMLQVRQLLTSSQLAVLEPYEATLLNQRLVRWVELSAYPF